MLNPASITAQAPGTFGDVGRNSLLGPGFFNLDAALVRFFPVKEETKFEFRLEAFNLFNRTNLVPPGFSVTAQTNLLSPGTPNATSGVWYDTTLRLVAQRPEDAADLKDKSGLPATYLFPAA
jgi:hypothetical protein